jgi:uncharacterized protein (DUF302 family)
MSSHTIREIEFTGIRLQIEAPKSLDDVFGELRRLCGKATIADIVEISAASPSEAVAAAQIESRFVPRSGFMIFAEIDHGAWIGRFGINRKAVRVILGNPLIAITMLRHDLTAGLFAPVELMVEERSSGGGSIVTYVRPSSLIAISSDTKLRSAAQALDEKLAALVKEAVEPSATDRSASIGAR